MAVQASARRAERREAGVLIGQEAAAQVGEEGQRLLEEAIAEILQGRRVLQGWLLLDGVSEPLHGPDGHHLPVLGAAALQVEVRVRGEFPCGTWRPAIAPSPTIPTTSAANVATTAVR